jgi:hypothetical protein
MQVRCPAGGHASLVHTRSSRHSELPTSAIPSAQAATETSVSDEAELLRAWIQAQGGYIHPDLVVQPTARCGTRGVSARVPISLDVISSQPLVMVPEQLYMTTTAAKERFNAMPGVFIGDLDPAMQLAILLAVERNLREASFWHAYIVALPAQPPCAWCMTAAQVAATCGELQRAMPELDIPGEVQRVRKQVQMECEIVATAFGSQLGVTAMDLFWAKAQVSPAQAGTNQTCFYQMWLSCTS